MAFAQDFGMTQTRRRPFALDELRAYLVEIFPQIWARGDYFIEEVGNDERDGAPRLPS